jgi:phage shock protein A
MYTKDEIIDELRQQLEAENLVKKNEVLINAEYKEVIEKLEMHIEILNNIIEDQSKKLANLRIKLKEAIVKN